MKRTIEWLGTMCTQEEGVYKKRGSLAKSPPDASFLAAHGRDKIAAWYLRIADFLELQTETMEIAMNLLDRFADADAAVRNDKRTFQLASVACLYSAVKVHEVAVMDPAMAEKLGQGRFAANDIVAMERRMLQTLDFRVSPPTASSFCRLLVSLLPVEQEDVIWDLATLQLLLALTDYDFVTVRPSTLAFASLVNALDCVELEPGVREEWTTILKEALSSSSLDPHTRSVQSALYVAVMHSELTEGGLPTPTCKAEIIPQVPDSPRGVEISLPAQHTKMLI